MQVKLPCTTAFNSKTRTMPINTSKQATARTLTTATTTSATTAGAATHSSLVAQAPTATKAKGANLCRPDAPKTFCGQAATGRAFGRATFGRGHRLWPLEATYKIRFVAEGHSDYLLCEGEYLQCWPFRFCVFSQTLIIRRIHI